MPIKDIKIKIRLKRLLNVPNHGFLCRLFMGSKPGPLFLAFRWHGKIIAGWLSRIHHFPFWQFENIIEKQ